MGLAGPGRAYGRTGLPGDMDMEVVPSPQGVNLINQDKSGRPGHRSVAKLPPRLFGVRCRGCLLGGSMLCSNAARCQLVSSCISDIETLKDQLRSPGQDTWLLYPGKLCLQSGTWDQSGGLVQSCQASIDTGSFLFLVRHGN